MKKSFSFLITSIILSCTLLACQQGSSFPVDNSESDQLGQYKLEESSIDNTNQVDFEETEETYTDDTALVDSPSMVSRIFSFSSIRTMKEDMLLNEKSSDNIYGQSKLTPSSLRELKGLDASYSESWVEWAGADDYFIYYTNASTYLAFMPFESNELLMKAMNERLMYDGTYEELAANQNIKNISKTSLPTDIGSAYECIFSTETIIDSKLRYYEYTDEESGILYILSQKISPEGTLRRMALFVFDGERSFMCSGTSSDISIHSAMKLHSEIVE